MDVSAARIDRTEEKDRKGQRTDAYVIHADTCDCFSWWKMSCLSSVFTVFSVLYDCCS